MGQTNEFVYNYFNIIPIENGYNLEIINSTNSHNFCVKINTYRSRYDRIRVDMFKLFKNLEYACIEEVINNFKTKVKNLKLSNIYYR